MKVLVVAFAIVGAVQVGGATWKEAQDFPWRVRNAYREASAGRSPFIFTG